MKSRVLKSVICMALVGASSVAMADQHSTTSQLHNVYVGVNLGYMSQPWRDTIGGDQAGRVSFSNWKNGNGGFGFGAYAGYMLQPHLGLEAGWTHAPTTKTTVTAEGRAFPETEIKNNAFYAAVKFTQKIGIQNTNVFGKAGVGLQSIKIKNGGGTVNDADTFGFYGALGLDYSATSNIHIDGSISYLTGFAKHSTHKFSTRLFYYNVSLGIISKQSCFFGPII